LNHTFTKCFVVFFASTLMGATLKDVSYSIKQNGIMVNLDYTEPIDDDDIIGWKSDRGWVYLTLLGVRAPKGKKPQQDFSGEVRKIVIDDFDESTQLAILIRKPILGYDIINSKTSPSTIVFIHTKMKKSEVATLKEYIKEKGTSVFNVAQSSGFPKYNTNFKNAFDEFKFLKLKSKSSPSLITYEDSRDAKSVTPPALFNTDPIDSITSSKDTEPGALTSPTIVKVFNSLIFGIQT